MIAPEKVTLTELQQVIRDKLYEALPGFFWVVAEIAEMKVNSSGHCYLELTESEKPGGRITSRARATIWAAKFRSINTLFTASTGIPLRQGITILFRAKVEYHELYGLSLNISDIDPSYTAGDMALRREAIIGRLTAEGIITMNRELDLAQYPRNIAVISSSGAAGCHDFINHLANNPYGYVFVPKLYETVMQGEYTERSVIQALDQISGEVSQFDAVVIIRGGGSTTDLSWFDSYDIAFHITQFPIPVLAGIGHEKDLSVTDMVAWRSLKTPTAVADFLVGQALDCENHIVEMAEALSSSAGDIITSTEEQLASLLNRTTATARLQIRMKNEQLLHYSENLRRSGNNSIRIAHGTADRLEQSLKHLDPAGVMRRGFTITTIKGVIIRSATDLHPGDTVLTHFENGESSSTVNETKIKS
ncbi:MAG: exodeoxyribonuclease VII large subunit [Bacteroidales bacterium]|nr:exodeoxyribonuclease VII large subunit [Bacteroidales bacterium]